MGARRLAGAAAALAVVLPAAGATAATIVGTQRANLIHGGPRADTIRARGGDDRIVAQDGGRDRISCGAGRDVVSADRSDRVAGDCETVLRQLQGDPLRERATGAQHATEVEPDSFAWGSTVVATYQSGRFRDGAATNIGVAASHDAGRTWRSRLLPGVTSLSGGRFPRASDPAVAYDSRHGTWLVVSLLVGQSSALGVSRSHDGGVTWTTPVIAAEASIGSLAYDKEWIVCDNGAASPFRGSCYVAVTDFTTHHLSVLTSRDGGATWSTAVPLLDTVAAEENVGATGAQPVVLPNGELHVLYDETSEFLTGTFYDSRSRDGGVTFLPKTPIATQSASIPRLRAPSAPSAEVGGDGRIHFAWADCRFEPGCSTDDIVLTSSADGVTWTAPQRIPLTIVGTQTQAFVPGLAADPASGRLAVTAYVLNRFGCAPAACRIRLAFATSADGGATWSATRYLEPEPLRLPWLALAGGRFLGDYISTSWATGRVVPVFTLAAAPRAGFFREAIFATSLPR